jgi:glutamate carboxypeptidase
MASLHAPGAAVSPDELAELGDIIDDELPAYLEDLATLVNIDCGSYTKAGVDRVGRWTSRFLERLGATVEVRPDPTLGDTVIGTFEGRRGAPRALLIGHLDTVFPEGTAQARPFRIEAGVARGPGVTDMKSGLLAGLYALLALRALGTDDDDDVGELPFERLVFVANPDEEIGSTSSGPHIRELALESDVCFVLECARANGDIVSARKGTVDLRLTVRGRAAHAGVEPEKGRSAILEAARQVIALHALNGRWPSVTVNAGVIEGGSRPNVVAESCRIELDLRAASVEEFDQAAAEVSRIVTHPTLDGVTAELTRAAYHPPMERTPASARLAALATIIAGELGFTVRDAATGGASDANTTSAAGLPSLDGLGPIGGDDHSVDEWLDLASVVPRTTLLAGLVARIGEAL